VKFQNVVYIRAKLWKGTDLSVPMIATPKIRGFSPEGRFFQTDPLPGAAICNFRGTSDANPRNAAEAFVYCE